MKRLVIISDTQCGSDLGLTHPNYNIKPMDTSTIEYELYELRNDYYELYRRELRNLQPVDILICNGDMIDGRGELSGSIELIEPDRSRQVAMAKAAIDEVKASKIFIAAGTPYHTGKYEDWESVLAEKVGADFTSHGFIDINGVVFDYRHKVGRSTVPYSRQTAIAKERLWNLLGNEFEEFPKSDVIIRSHVHYHVFAGGSNWLALTTPALQSHGTRYGSRQCTGTIDFGFVHFDIEENGDYSWQAHIFRPRSAQIKAVKV